LHGREPSFTPTSIRLRCACGTVLSVVQRRVWLSFPPPFDVFPLLFGAHLYVGEHINPAYHSGLFAVAIFFFSLSFPASFPFVDSPCFLQHFIIESLFYQSVPPYTLFSFPSIPARSSDFFLPIFTNVLPVRRSVIERLCCFPPTFSVVSPGFLRNSCVFS